MKILMFGWEFPPNNWGGLGTACHGLSKSLSKKGVEIIFVLPRGQLGKENEHLKLLSTDEIKIKDLKIRFKYIDSPITAYETIESYHEKVTGYTLDSGMGKTDIAKLYGKDLLLEVEKFAQKATLIADFEDFDLIHAHDWLTYKAGIAAKKASGKPLIIHVHATEFDRSGTHVNQAVYDIERLGIQSADKIITVSNLTKNTILEHYGADPNKITVVHNGVIQKEKVIEQEPWSKDEKIVLFLGRITRQKGPDYFLDAAKAVLDVQNNVKFIIVGGGDMYSSMIERAAELGIGKHVLFAGYLKGDEVDRAYKMADLYVMPSVSEPFGITPLEALRNNTPVLISKQSGVSEVLANALKTDFWDIQDMANKILSAINYQSLNHTLAYEGQKEVETINWDLAAEKCIDVYKEVCS